MLSLAPHMNTSNVYLYLEQIFLRDRNKPVEEPLHNKERVTPYRRLGNHESSSGS